MSIRCFKEEDSIVFFVETGLNVIITLFLCNIGP